MYSISPLETQQTEHPRSSPPGAGWGAIAALIVVVVLIVGAIVVMGSGDNTDSPGTPTPTQAPLNPGT